MLLSTGWKQSAIVEFEYPDEAQWVVENLNGNIAEGLEQPIAVRFADAVSNGTGVGKAAGPCKAAGPGKVVAPGKASAGKTFSKNDGGKAGKGKAPGSFQTLYEDVQGTGLYGSNRNVPQECQVYFANLP